MSTVKEILSHIDACTIKLFYKTWKNCLSNHEKRAKITNCYSKTLHQKYPAIFKKPSSYSFQGSDEESQLPSRSGLFLGSNPPPNGQDILKQPLSGHNIRPNN
jgi:hypothetical protein